MAPALRGPTSSMPKAFRWAIEPPPAPSVSTWIIGTPMRWRRKSMLRFRLVWPPRQGNVERGAAHVDGDDVVDAEGRGHVQAACGAEAGPELMALTARRRMISPTASPPLDWK